MDDGRRECENSQAVRSCRSSSHVPSTPGRCSVRSAAASSRSSGACRTTDGTSPPWPARGSSATSSLTCSTRRFGGSRFTATAWCLPPPRPIASERDLVDYINCLNASWVSSARRLSPRVLTDLYELASGEAADWYESLSLDAPALLPVSWAGEQASAGWFDLGREFTEVWHHQQQVRMAVGAAPLGDPRYLAAVIGVAMRGLPVRVQRRASRVRALGRVRHHRRERWPMDVVVRRAGGDALQR